MAASRSIRIRMPDRPGALSHICIALAAFDVNISRLDVVSQANAFVVDDLDLESDTLTSIDRAVASFHNEVEVQYFEQPGTDPVVAACSALERIAKSPQRSSEVTQGVALVCRADWAVIVELGADGRPRRMVDGSPVAPPGLALGDDLSARGAISVDDAMAGAIAEWLGMPASRVAVASLSPGHAVIAGRRRDIAFAPGELARLASFASMVAALDPASIAEKELLRPAV